MVVCRFEPWGVDAHVEAGTTVLAAARQAGVPLEAQCAGTRACGTCAVKVERGELGEPTNEERAIIAGRAFRLGCRARIVSDVTVRPLVGVAARPRVETLAQPQNENAVTGVEDAAAATVTLDKGESIAYVAGIDVGTTTIKVGLLREGAKPLIQEIPNAQSSWGADVISRLFAAQQNDEIARKLRDSAQSDCARVLSELIEIAERQDAAHVTLTRVAIAANTIMAALFCGVDLSAYSQPPYGTDENPTLNDGPLVDFVSAHYPDAQLLVLPALGQLVGGDITAGLIATGAFSADGSHAIEPYLFVDVGTNVETAYVTDAAIIVGSAPAGSAFSFEGERGARALQGLQEALSVGALAADGLLLEGHESVWRGSDEVLRVRTTAGEFSQLDIRSFQLAKAAFSVSISEVLTAAHSAKEPAAGERVRLVIGGVFGSQSFEALGRLGFIPPALKSVAEVESRAQAALEGALAYASNPSGYHFDDKPIEPLNFVADPQFSLRLMQHLNFEEPPLD